MSSPTRTRSRALPFVVVWLAVALVVPAAACDVLGRGRGTAQGAAGNGEAVVVRVVDGDTVVVRLGGDDETVRLIGIDTPETKKPNSPVECFGPEAAAQLDALLPGGTVVQLERDAEERDRYGRLLAYARRADDGLLVNEAMVAGGFATTLRIAPNVARSDELAAAEAAARAAGEGLWGRCDGGHRPLPP